MANFEHLKILKQGAEVWNQWRRENPRIVPDLREANLFEVDLSGADLSGANLSGTSLNAANLKGADLFRAVLSPVFLREADLSGADLSRADLFRVNLFEADLRFANLSEDFLNEADLRGSYLFKTNLHGAFLRLADLKNARCLHTIFNNVDLSEAKNLDTINHKGPSTIGIDTLYNSKGNIPEVFLRGCGVPDSMIEYAKSLTANPIEYYSCFVSYSHKDEDFAKRLYNDLQANNVRSWLACEDMRIGDKIRSTIEESIRLHDKLLLIFSENSMKSKWVKHEVENALDLEIEREKTVLFPVRVDDAVMESKADWASTIKEKRHIGDFTRWKNHDAYTKAFDRLLRDLKAGQVRY